LDQALYVFLVARLQAHALVHAESGVLPAPNVLDHLLGDLAFAQELDGDYRARHRPAQLAQEPPVETEVDPQPLGDREHELAVGHLVGTDVLGS
jgi:hypothetical protein